MLVGIREATVGDAQAIATIHVDSWQAAYRGMLPDAYLANLTVAQRSEAWRKSIIAGRPRVLVAHTDIHSATPSDATETILGWVAFGDSRDGDKDHRWGEVETLYIAPWCWRKGIGRILIDAARHALRSAGYTDVALWVLLDNRRARAFYKRSGFVCDNSSRGVQLGGKWLTELRYCCPLGQT
ncbi:N-acetyltransferase GCN5 [Caballeronia udeis]|uniref:N-acetyltransferase GCN5 n=1 Tax=Caballeronia udeis TaxID=1232866 RepID=A0A158I173_9BURK|nr:GNAT family N-acetyltransferase [Caballeronia udeis]SAL50362.1 N-acetyltransferase GCN5 [Caballeronia udeis]